MSAPQPCPQYLDCWRIGNEWIKVPEGNVCPRCGFYKHEHAQPLSGEGATPPQAEQDAEIARLRAALAAREPER